MSIGDFMDFITLKNITKNFDGVDVLKDINLKINEGETLGILGRSGSGKSVLINMLRGTLDYKPDAGNIIMNLAVCPDCLAVDSPSHVGERCNCGGTLEAKEVDFFNAESAIDQSKRCDNIVDWVHTVAEHLSPTLNNYSKRQIDLVMALLIYEQSIKISNSQIHLLH